MKKEKIIEILKSHQWHPIMDDFPSIPSEEYNEVASEICQEQDEEMKEAVGLLKEIKSFINKTDYLIYNRDRSKIISTVNNLIDQFIQQHSK